MPFQRYAIIVNESIIFDDDASNLYKIFQCSKYATFWSKKLLFENFHSQFFLETLLVNLHTSSKQIDIYASNCALNKLYELFKKIHAAQQL